MRMIRQLISLTLLLGLCSCASSSMFKKKVSWETASKMLLDGEIESVDGEGEILTIRTKSGRWYYTRTTDLEKLLEDFKSKEIKSK